MKNWKIITRFNDQPLVFSKNPFLKFVKIRDFPKFLKFLKCAFSIYALHSTEKFRQSSLLSSRQWQLDKTGTKFRIIEDLTLTILE